MNKLTPKYVRQRLHQIRKEHEALNEEARDLCKRCSHKGTVSSYHEYEDSGWECSACGTCWRLKPEGVD